MAHRSGFVNIIGLPNSGKSTLMNALVGEKLSIITHKAQTTRHRIMGIVSGEDFQIVYSDTPGIVKPHYKLHESMMKFVEAAFTDADILLLIIDIKEGFDDEETLERIRKSRIPLIIVINKIDLSDQPAVEKELEGWQKSFPDATVIPASALHQFNIEKIFDTILEKLPESPAYYDKETLTDKTERFFASEILREKIFLNYQKEIPYSTEVYIESYKESETLIRILAYIFVTRESQKAIILGHQGNAIKKTGTEARKELEEWTGKKVYLEMSVKVRKDWRNDDKSLRQLGYEE